MLGHVVGSLPLSLMLPSGRRKWLFVFGTVAIIGTGMTLVEEIWTIIVGRFIHGCTIPIFMAIVTRMYDETVPQHLLSGFGNYTNISYNVGLMLVMLAGLGLPQGTKLSDDELRGDQFWRVCYGMPIVINLLGMLSLLFFFKEDSLNFLIALGPERKEEALSIIAKIYAEEPESIYNEIKSQQKED